MNQRTKWLLLGVAAVFGLYSIDQLYRSQIEQPSNNLTAELEGLTKKLQANKESQALARSSSKRLETYQHRSLPYDPQLARSAYQDWLLSLVEKHNIESAAVDAAQPRAIEIKSRVDRRKRIRVGHSIAYTLRGQASLAKWSDWLQEFNRAGHLHKIGSLALNPVGSKGVLDATLTIEILSLTTAIHKDQLSDWVRVNSVQDGTTEDYQQFVRRNLFAKGFAKSLYQIELKAITVDRSGQAQAWFRLDERGAVEAVQSEQQLPVQLHEITVIEILPNKVLIQVNREPYWITLGQTVGEVCETQQKS
jgi:hypothetical protein